MTRINLPWSTVYAFTTGAGMANKRFIPVTGWMSAAQFKRIRAIFETVALQTNMSITFAFQTANFENAPDALTTSNEVGTASTTDAMNVGTLTDISSITNGRSLIRFGFTTVNVSAAVLIACRVGGSLEYTDC